MATESGTAHARVIDSEMKALLEAQPYAFSFFQAVHLLEAMFPERNRVGEFAPPSSEIVRFGVPASMTFPASEIQSLTFKENGPAEMIVSFMGLTGPSGVLPLYYTELVQTRVRERDTGLQHFLDMFNHRLISLFYRAWEKYRFTVSYEKQQSERDRFSLQLLSLIGLGTPGLQNRHYISDETFIYYAGLLMGHSRSATVLKQIIADYFGVNVEIQEFAGSWYSLAAREQTRFDETSDDSLQLGFGAVAGDEVWQDQSGVRIRVGPLTLVQYLEFLPGRPAYQALKAWTRFFSGDELDFEVQLVLKRDEVPACELGSDGQAAPRLGWVTWLKSLPFGSEAADTILRL